MKTNLKTLMLALAVSGTFFSCSNEEEVSGLPLPLKPLSFTASTGTDGQSASASGRKETKLVDGSKVEFEANDSISVFVGNKNNPFTTTEEGSTVTFKGSVEETGSDYTALYPYQKEATNNPLAGLRAVLPTVQYAVGNGTYDPKAALSVAYTTDTDRTFNFKNVTSMVKFTLQGSAARIVLKSTGGSKIAGGIIVTGVKNGTLSVNNQGANSSDSIVLKPANRTTTITAGTYYINVIPVTNANLTLSAYPTTSSATASGTLPLAPVTLNRSKILNVGTLVAETGPEYVEIGGVKWAKANIGGTTETDFGDYYQWGSVNKIYTSMYTSGTGVRKFDWLPGKEAGFVNENCEYTSNYDLDAAHDIVTATYGDGWRLPTYYDFNKTIDACGGNSQQSNTLKQGTDPNTQEQGIYWFSDYKGVSGVLFCDGNGNKLFFPAAGYGHNLSYYDSTGGYWTKEIDHNNDQNAHYLGISSTIATTSTSVYKREYGWTVRGVKD